MKYTHTREELHKKNIRWNPKTGKLSINLRVLLEEMPEPTEIPRLAITVTPGAGKTYEALREFLSSGLATTTRLYFAVPTHPKASELKKDFDKLAVEAGIDVQASIMSGLERSCLAKKKGTVRSSKAVRRRGNLAEGERVRWLSVR